MGAAPFYTACYPATGMTKNRKTATKMATSIDKTDTTVKVVVG